MVKNEVQKAFGSVDENVVICSSVLFQLIFLKRLEAPSGAVFDMSEFDHIFIEFSNSSIVDLSVAKPYALENRVPFFTLFPVTELLTFSLADYDGEEFEYS